MNSISYDQALHIQKSIWLGRDFETETYPSGYPDLEFLAFSPPSIWTVGQRSGRDHALENYPDLVAVQESVVSVDRGGAVTYHGPGQVVLFPVPSRSSNLIRRRELIQRGPRAWVCFLEKKLMGWAQKQGITLKTLPGFPGVFSEQHRKCASIGLRFTREGIFHGMAINVTHQSLHGFEKILPCGLKGVEVTCLNQLHETFQWSEQGFMNSFCSLDLKELQIAPCG